MKQVLTVQDLSCVGKCSLTVALPVLSAMGCACSVLPTALLSTHTGFEKPYVRSLTEDIDPICTHIQSTGIRFDAVSVGYLSDPEQVAQVIALADRFSATTIVDPAMGDNGKRYSGITKDHVQAMAELCKKADYLLPNVTEAALLTGMPYEQTEDAGYYRELLQALCDFGARAAVLTGVSYPKGQTGFVLMEKDNEVFEYRADKIPGSFHGTGDLFSAAFTGGLLKEKTAPEAAELAAGFVERVVAHAPKATPFGVEFEPQLPWLWENL